MGEYVDLEKFAFLRPLESFGVDEATQKKIIGEWSRRPDAGNPPRPTAGDDQLIETKENIEQLVAKLSNLTSSNRAFVKESFYFDGGGDLDDLLRSLELLHDAVRIAHRDNPRKYGRPKTTERRRIFAKRLKMILEDAGFELTTSKKGVYFQCLKTCLVETGDIGPGSDQIVKKLVESVLKKTSSSDEV